MRALLFGFMLIASLCSATNVAVAEHAPASLQPVTIAIRVAHHYGDSHPHIVHLQRTQTDSPPGQSMYVIKISGGFRRAGKRALYLEFSALAQRWYVWGIAAYDSHHHRIWTDASLPHPAH